MTCPWLGSRCSCPIILFIRIIRQAHLALHGENHSSAIDASAGEMRYSVALANLPAGLRILPARAAAPTWAWHRDQAGTQPYRRIRAAFQEGIMALRLHL